MAENIEIKARCLDPAFIRNKVQEIETVYLGTDFQRDTYYRVKNGRFKLRESKLDGNYLIPYIRPDQTDPKKSFYAKIEIDNPEVVKNLLKKIFGIQTVISKKREIYTYENVRIHLDTVDHLGDFIELEAVLNNEYSDTESGKKKIKYLMKVLQIKRKDLIAESYAKMISEERE